MTMVSPALLAFAARPPSRSGEAVSSATITSGVEGKALGWTSRSAPSRTEIHRGTSSGWLPHEHQTFFPCAATYPPRPSMEPRASGSGLTWQASAICPARESTSAARSSWRSRSSRSVTRRVSLLGLDQLEELRHPLQLSEADVLLELQVGEELQPDLVAQDGPEMRPGRLQAGPRPPVIPVLSENRVEDRGPAQVRRDLDPGDGDEPDPGVLQPGNLLGQDLPEFLGYSLRSNASGHRSALLYPPSLPAREGTGPRSGSRPQPTARRAAPLR